MLRSGLERVNRRGALQEPCAQGALARLQAHERLRMPDTLHDAYLVVQERGEGFGARQVYPDEDVVTAGGDGDVLGLRQLGQFVRHGFNPRRVHLQPDERGRVVTETFRVWDRGDLDDLVLQQLGKAAAGCSLTKPQLAGHLRVRGPAVLLEGFDDPSVDVVQDVLRTRALSMLWRIVRDAGCIV